MSGTGGGGKGLREYLSLCRGWLARHFVSTYCVVRWVYHKVRNGQPWHLRGVDVFTVRDGKVAANLAYATG
jgi:ketosteroid isomerase-like protein